MAVLSLVGAEATLPASPPLISCLMVTRGDLVLAQFAIDCYRRQTWPNRELVIVGDAPHSDVPDFIATLGDSTIRYVPTAPAALGALRNVSVEAARGALLCQWDDDDLYHRERLEFQYGQLVAARAAAHFLSRWVMWWPEQRQLALAKRRIWEGSMLARREAVGSYPAIARREDTRAVADLRQRGNRITYTDQPLAYCYIIHGANGSGPRQAERLFARATETIGADEYVERLEQLAEIFPLHAYREALARSGRAV
jgi:glycosyltransferase involved in cell wall biosynthesis